MRERSQISGNADEELIITGDIDAFEVQDMSRKDFQGATHSFAVWMQQAADEIDAGIRKGADRKWTQAHPRIRLGGKRWWTRRTDRKAS